MTDESQSQLIDLKPAFDQIYADAAAEDYLGENTPYGCVTWVQGVPVEPDLRPSFFITDNAQRPQQEIEDWWDRPFIQPKAHNNSVVYEVWCLDGGAWDRPTYWGEGDSLLEAVLIAKQGPS